VTAAATEWQDDRDARPTGFVRPPGDRAAHALAAIEAARLADADKHIDALPDSTTLERAWKLYLRGLVDVERAAFEAAESFLMQAFSLGLADGRRPEEGMIKPGSLRLAALAIHRVGSVYRRQDRPDDAYQTHLTAFDLRETYGSHEEMWETAADLGLDAGLARRHASAQKWHRLAVKMAKSASEEPARKQAIAWGNLSNSLLESGRPNEAVDAAVAAQACWCTHDSGAAETARAGLAVGYALLRQAESLHDTDDRKAATVLQWAVAELTTARDGLEAFGPDHAADVLWCQEQLDFAERLQRSLGSQ
jgi:hypothetical protein